MELIYPVNQKSMSDKIDSVFTSIHSLISSYRKINFKSMSIMQSMGYNGFKRWHRFNSKCLFKMELCLANELYDKFRIPPSFKDVDLSYSVSTMEEHLKSWEAFILSSIQELGKLAMEYYQLTGTSCRIIYKLMDMLEYDFEKVGKYLKRFNESDWLALDVHIVDDFLHEKYNKKEMKRGKESRTA